MSRRMLPLRFRPQVWDLEDRLAPAVLSDNLSATTADTVAATGTTYQTSSFLTDAANTTLTSVTLLLSNPTGGAAEVDVYTDGGNQPGTLVGALTSPTTYSTALAQTTFTSAGITLSANSTYWVVLKATSGEFDWAYTLANTGTGTGFQGTYGYSNDAGSTWFTYDVYPTQMSVTAGTGSASAAGAVAFAAATYSTTEASGTATITLSRTGGSTGAVTVPITVSGGTATAGTDYTGVPTTVTFADGATTATVTLTIVNDTLAEGAETATFALGTPGNGATLGGISTATVTIADDDTGSAGTVAFGAAAYTAAEGTGTVTIILVRGGDTTAAVTVPVTVSGGTATAGTDFTGVPATVSFAAGQTTANLTLSVPDDAMVEGSETAVLVLGTPTGGIVLGTPAAATLTITDNDTAATTYTAVASGGTAGTVLVYDASGALVRTLTPFGSTFTGGVRVATADVTGDGVDDVIVGAGPGGAPAVMVINGSTFATLASFTAFETTFSGGVYVAAGDVTGDGKADVIVTPDQGGGPVVAVYSGATLATGSTTTLQRFLGIDDASFRGGARAAAGDLNADGYDDLVVSAGYLGGPRISTYSGSALAAGATTHLTGDFFAFEDTLRNGAFVTVGDFNNDGYADLAFGGGPSGGPRVLVVNGRTLLTSGSAAALASPLANFFAGDSSLRGGVRLATGDANGDGVTDLITGSGDGEESQVRVYYAARVAGGSTSTADRTFDPFGTVLTNGVYVG